MDDLKPETVFKTDQNQKGEDYQKGGAEEITAEKMAKLIKRYPSSKEERFDFLAVKDLAGSSHSSA